MRCESHVKISGQKSQNCAAQILSTVLTGSNPDQLVGLDEVTGDCFHYSSDSHQMLEPIFVPNIYGIVSLGSDFTVVYYKIKILSSSCEIKDVIGTHIFHAVCDTPIARIVGCVLIKDIGRRLPLELQCSYQGQQGHVNQSVHENYRKTRF